MPDLTIRGVSDELHDWLKRQAQAHRRSVNREAIALLEAMRAERAVVRRRPSPDEILAMARRFSSLPVSDARSPDEIMGYDEHGLPHQ